MRESFQPKWGHIKWHGSWRILQGLIYTLITFYLTLVFCWFSDLIQAHSRNRFKQYKIEWKMSFLAPNPQFHTPKLPLLTIFYLSFQKIFILLKYKLCSIVHIVFTFCISVYGFALVCLTTYILLNGCIKIYLITLLLPGAEDKGMTFNAKNNQRFKKTHFIVEYNSIYAEKW